MTVRMLNISDQYRLFRRSKNPSKSKEIEEFFKSFNPEINAERIMTEISGKMDVIDTVRSEQDRMSRFHMTVSVCCLIVGLLTGSVLMSIVIFILFA